MLNLLPMLGLVAPPILYLAFFSINSSTFSGLGLAGDNMLQIVGFGSLICWSWSAFYSRSVNRFFRKRDKGNFKLAFGVNSTVLLLQTFLWVFGDLTLSNTLGGAMSGVAVLVLLMFLGGNAVRVWLTGLAFEVGRGDAINSQKFNLIIETLVYSPAIAWSVYVAYTTSGMGL